MTIAKTIAVLDEEHKKQLQDGFVELLLDRLKQDLDEWGQSEWSFDTHLLEDVTREAIESVVNDVEENIKKQYSRTIEKFVGEAVRKHFAEKEV